MEDLDYVLKKELNIFDVEDIEKFRKLLLLLANLKDQRNITEGFEDANYLDVNRIESNAFKVTESVLSRLTQTKGE